MNANMMRDVFRLTAVLLVALLAAAYANHFDNGFHFDDGHAIVENPSIRSIGNVPRFFVDATTFSILPSNQSYRPVLQTTLALDYWLAGGYTPRVFQASSFVWFVIQLVLMFLLFSGLLRRAGTAHAEWIALAATALYGLHPAGAETVNYVIQRGEILAAIGVIGALGLYVRRPALRRYGLYLIPALLGALAKPTALVFPAVLFVYVWLFERGERPTIGRRLAAILPSIVAMAGVGLWIWSRMPATHSTGGGPADLYLLTQGWVTLRYAVTAVAPVWLSADHDAGLLPGLMDTRAIVGLVFIASIVWLAVRTGRTQKAIAFGLWWFLLALAPTSLTPLAEVSNDHRLFLPLAGLALAAASAAALLWQRAPAGLRRPTVVVTVVVVVLIAEVVGVRARNAVWRSDEALWQDVTVKSPLNGRGLMNYGVALIARGEFHGALPYFERARALQPDSPLVHINLAITHGALGQPRDAEAGFLRAMTLAPNDWRSHLYYGRWLGEAGRYQDAVREVTRARSANPLDPEPERLLARTLAAWADQKVNRSLDEYRTGRFADCLATVRQGLAIRPDSAALHNNASACHNSLGEWDSGIAAAREALRLQPDFAIASNNLAFALARKGAR